ncbi:MAG: hypothetical protein EOP06_07290 [Proteobacteria bacterium]|nr:MAG: hypothetical protein EOP06_07290 [Pseudomonadota bacterium]
MKLKIAILTGLLGFAGFSNAAIYSLNNVVNGPGDTLHANSLNQLSTGTVVTIGVFTAGFDLASSLTDQAALLTNYTTLTSGLTGGPSETLGAALAPGYIELAADDQPSITGNNPLIGRSLYSFIGNAATLALSTEFALVLLGTIQEDLPNELSYSSNPGGISPLIGKLDSFTGEAAAGTGTYVTLQTQVIVPEPSAALLGMVGALGLLRRRRN